MQNAVTAYDISALIIFAICGGYFIHTNPTRTARYTMFIHVLIVGIIGGAADIARIILASNGYCGTMLLNAVHILYLLSISMIAPMYAIYIAGITDTWHIFSGKKPYLLMAIAPLSADTLIILSGLFLPTVSEILPDGKIICHWGYVVCIVMAFYYMFICLDYIRILRKYMNALTCIDMVVPVIVMNAAFILQFLLPSQHVIIVGAAFNCLFLILIGRRSEESLDITTGMHTFWIFANDMKLRLETGKKMDIILVNIVNYKHVVHIAGYDEVIKMMKPLSAEIIKVLKARKVSYLCYYNGDGKFAIEVSGRDMTKIHEIATDIYKAVNVGIKLDVSDFDINVNVCIAGCPDDISDVESLFMLIDDLNMVENSSKVLLASDITSTEDFAMKKSMATILDRAISNHYFSVFYQPIYNVKEKRFASAEALVRLRDPQYGYISPTVFIPMAEKSGAIHKIGSFIIDEVCRFIASDEFEALNVDYIELNLSVMQCLRNDLADEIIGKSEEYGIDPKKLNLEITETASEYSQEKLRSNIFALNRAGFDFSLDDFGTGYSNLMRISSIPLSITKLDRTFVLLEEKGGFHTIISNVIRMLKDMGMDVLVEGVETEEMKEAFIEMGVDEIQGFYFSRPLAKNDYVRFVREKHNI